MIDMSDLENLETQYFFNHFSFLVFDDKKELMSSVIREILFELFNENNQLRYLTDEQLVPLVSKKLLTVPNERRKAALIILIRQARIGL
jgi:hypothetical protein